VHFSRSRFVGLPEKSVLKPTSAETALPEGTGQPAGDKRCYQYLCCDILRKIARFPSAKGGRVTYLHECMLPLADLTLWLLTTLVEIFVVYLFIIQGLFRKFLFLSFYFLLSVTISFGRYVLYDFRFVSYVYLYYLTDFLLTVFLFLSICELSVRLAGSKMPRERVTLWSTAALLATALFSFSVASSSISGLTTHLVVELSQAIYFACCLVIVLLWARRLRNDPQDGIAAQFVNVLSVYFSLFLLIHGARQLAPHASSFNSLYPMVGAWLPLGCGFALVSHERPRRTEH